jgi:transcriptional regulator with XRE-family HTH domain
VLKLGCFTLEGLQMRTQEPISHNVLVNMIKYRIRQTGLTIQGICSRTHISQAELIEILEGRMMASPRHLARLAIVLEAEWNHIAAGYGLWLFEMEKQKAGRLPTPGGKVGTIFRNLELCTEIIQGNPHLDPEELVSIIYAKLPLDRSAIRNQIAHVRSQPGGNYHYG